MKIIDELRKMSAVEYDAIDEKADEATEAAAEAGKSIRLAIARLTNEDRLMTHLTDDERFKAALANLREAMTEINTIKKLLE